MFPARNVRTKRSRFRSRSGPSAGSAGSGGWYQIREIRKSPILRSVNEGDLVLLLAPEPIAPALEICVMYVLTLEHKGVPTVDFEFQL
ncbi:MAG: hypothetical protein CMJ80_10065 [Planctomycetaceae bacterium]|nr:hypothetical protein [Planctomycetaceae bacterium]